MDYGPMCLLWPFSSLMLWYIYIYAIFHVLLWFLHTVSQLQRKPTIRRSFCSRLYGCLLCVWVSSLYPLYFLLINCLECRDIILEWQLGWQLDSDNLEKHAECQEAHLERKYHQAQWEKEAMKEGQPFCDFSLQHREIRPNPRQGLPWFLPSKERNKVQSQTMFISWFLSPKQKNKTQFKYFRVLSS